MATLLAIVMITGSVIALAVMGYRLYQQRQADALPPDTFLYNPYNPENPLDVYHQIRMDANAGTIDRETEVRLLFKAVYFPDLLPTDYRTTRSADQPVSLTMELNWLYKNYDQLTAGTRQLLDPFIVSAIHPESYFHPSHDLVAFAGADQGTKNRLSSEPGQIQSIVHGDACSGCSTDIQHLSETSADWFRECDRISWGKRRIAIAGAPEITLHYVKEEYNHQLERLDDIEAAVKKSWLMFHELLGVKPEKNCVFF